MTSVFKNCFLKIFGPPDDCVGDDCGPDPGCPDCGGGCDDPSDCGCTDCDDGDDGCDGIVVLTKCISEDPAQNDQDGDGIPDCDINNRVYTLGQLVDAGCIPDCQTPPAFGCEDCSLGFPPSKCVDCCPVVPPTITSCSGWVCSARGLACPFTYQQGGCASFITFTVVGDVCPDKEPISGNNETLHPTKNECLILEGCFRGLGPTTPAPRPPKGGPCPLWKCEIVGTVVEPGSSSPGTTTTTPERIRIIRDCTRVVATAETWSTQLGITCVGGCNCANIQSSVGAAGLGGYYGSSPLCEANCDDILIDPVADQAAGNCTFYFCKDDGTGTEICTPKTKPIQKWVFPPTSFGNTQDPQPPTICDHLIPAQGWYRDPNCNNKCEQGDPDGSGVFYCEDPANDGCTLKIVDPATIGPGNVLPDGTQVYPDAAGCRTAERCCVETSKTVWSCNKSSSPGGDTCLCVTSLTNPSCDFDDIPEGTFLTEDECYANTECCKPDSGDPSTGGAVNTIASQYPFDANGQPDSGIPIYYCEGDSVQIQCADAAAIAALSEDFDLSFESNANIAFSIDTGNILIGPEALEQPGAFFKISVDRNCCDNEPVGAIEVLLIDIARKLPPFTTLCSTSEPDITDPPVNGPEYCPVAYCDETNTCVRTFVLLRDITDLNFDPFSECPAEGTQIRFTLDINGSPTSILGIAGNSCPSQCTGQLRTYGLNTSVAQGTFSYKEVNTYTERLKGLRRNDKVFDTLADTRRFGLSGRSRTFTPIINPGYHQNLLGSHIHVSLYYALEGFTTNRTVPDAAYDDINQANLLQSLNPEARKIIQKATDTAGNSITGVILDKLIYLIRLNRLHEITLGDIRSISNHGENIYNSFPKGIASENNVLSIIDEKAKPLYYDKYLSEKTRDRMRVWKTLAPDLNKHILLVERDGTALEHPVSIQDQWFFEASGGIETKSILDGDFWLYTKRDGTPGYAGVFSDIAKAVMLDLVDAAKAVSLLGDKYSTKLTATSVPIARIEEEADLSAPRQDAYYMKLDLDEIEDLNRDKPLIRKTLCTYRWEQDFAVMDEWIKFKPWPYLTVYLDHEDPFLDHLEKRKSITAEFKDISFDSFIGYEEDFPTIPRRIPFYMVIIPTDDIRRTIKSVGSRSVDYSTREVTVPMFNLIENTSTKYGRWTPPGATISLPELGEDVDRNTSRVGGVEASTNINDISTRVKPYVNESEPLPRRPSAFRKFMSAIREAIDEGEYIDQDTKTMAWGTVYQRMDLDVKNAIKSYEVKEFNALRGKFLAGTPTPSEIINSELPRLTNVPPQDINTIDEFVKPVVTKRKITIDPDIPDGPILT